VDFVAISLDSLDPRKNDYVKGVKGSWKKAMQSIEKLHENGIRVGVSPTISQFNLYEMVEFTNYFLRKGIPVWYCLYSYDSSNDSEQLFKIGKRNDEFLITDNKAMVELCDALIDMEKKNSNILITTKTLEAVKNLYSSGNRIWKCRALRNFFIIDHLGRVAGCHLNKPVTSIFNLPKVWNSEEFNALRRIYGECSKCIYLCYIVYSLHGSVRGNLEIAREKWRSAKLFLKRKSS
jgi:MoaA/NifB/PqqE/SkfB family radical SAM enzyme